jgi:hypothetical protein
VLWEISAELTNSYLLLPVTEAGAWCTDITVLLDMKKTKGYLSIEGNPVYRALARLALLPSLIHCKKG